MFFKERDVLQKPINQTSEALYCLIRYSNMSRKDFFEKTGILNAPNVIMKLRRAGVDIVTHEIKKVNKFGRPVSYGVYSLTDKTQAKFQYLKINK